MMADSTNTTILFSLMNHLQSAIKGGITIASLTFFITSTVSGGLYQVRRWEAGSWIVITMAEFFIILPHGPNCWMGLGAFRDLVRLKPATFSLSICACDLPARGDPGGDSSWMVCRARVWARARVLSSMLIL